MHGLLPFEMLHLMSYFTIYLVACQMSGNYIGVKKWSFMVKLIKKVAPVETESHSFAKASLNREDSSLSRKRNVS